MQKGVRQIVLIGLLTVSQLSFSIPTVSEFYEVYKDALQSKVDGIIADLEGADLSDEWKARLGAIEMRRSTYYELPKDRIAPFKRGRIKLEEQIKKHPSNVEFRFLRLTIQENCPKILKYRSNIQADKKMIVDGFKGLSSTVQFHVKEYAKRSDVLSADLFH